MAGITVSSITSLVARYTNSVVNEQANEESRLLDESILPRKRAPDKVGVVNVKAGELSSIGILADGGTLPTGAYVTPTQGTYSPVAFFGRIAVGRVAASLASSLEDGIDLVKEEMESCGRGLGRQLGRAIASLSLGSPAASASIGDTTFTVNDPSGFRVGMTVSIYNSSTPVEDVTITKVAPTTDGTASTITCSTLTANWTTSYTIYLKGQYGGGFLSFADATANASLYGVAATSNEWSGNLVSNSGTLRPLTLDLMRSTMRLHRRRRGKRPSHVLCNAVQETNYSNLLINNRRFPSGSGKMDAVGGDAFEFEGVPVVADENFGDNDMFLVNMEDCKLHEFRSFSPDFDGQADKSMNRGAVIVDQTNLTYDVQVWGAFNMRFNRRNGISRITDLAAA